MPPFVDITGHKYGKLLVIGRSGMLNGRVSWLCRCDCGGDVVVTGNNLRTGNTIACGCGRFGNTKAKTHGLTGTPEYRSWQAMFKRCDNPNSEAYHHYGGRGIGICERWKEFTNFLADMGHRPSMQHSLDRKDNDGNYEPGNCRWATKEEQARNQRRNHILTMAGRSQCLAAWAKEFSIEPSKLRQRIRRGLSIEQALELAD